MPTGQVACSSACLKNAPQKSCMSYILHVSGHPLMPIYSLILFTVGQNSDDVSLENLVS